MQVEASKQSTYKFLKVLAGLRDWEICAPDVSAAIEFCREKIVEMSVEEYEEFFTHQFPSVVRPHTAPPITGNKKNIAPTSAPPAKKPKDKDQNRGNSKSAPAGGRHVNL